MLPGSFVLCVLLAVLGSFQNETTSSKIQATCGMRQIYGAGFGATRRSPDDTLFGEFPWVVAILSNYGLPPTSNCQPTRYSKQLEYKLPSWTGWQFSCVGTLLNSRAVLTAAHCVSHLMRQKCILRVRAGEYDFSTDQERYPHVEVEVLKVITHNNFSEDGFYNDDIALLILKSPIEEKPHIRFACLPDANMIPDPTQNCIVAGWGINRNYPWPQYPPRHLNIMRLIQMSLIEREDCQNQLREVIILGPENNLHESYRCAIGTGKMYWGEIGAALVCPLPGELGRYVQYGIVAICMGQGEPNLFTDTTKYRDWIDLNVEENIHDTINDSHVISVG